MSDVAEVAVDTPKSLDVSVLTSGGLKIHPDFCGRINLNKNGEGCKKFYEGHCDSYGNLKDNLICGDYIKSIERWRSDAIPERVAQRTIPVSQDAVK